MFVVSLSEILGFEKSMLIMVFVYQELQEFPDSPDFFLPIKLSFNVGLKVLIIIKNEKKYYLTFSTHIITLILQIIIVRSTCLPVYSPTHG